MSHVLDGPALWYFSRASGVVLTVLLTLSCVLGVLSTSRSGSRRWPRFATQRLHRNVCLLAVGWLVAHAASAVADTFVAIAWWDAFLPFTGRYQPRWVGLGALALDLLVVVVVTSMIRPRMTLRRWRAVHLTSYLAWGLGLAHGLGIGTDTGTGWALAVTAISIAAMIAAGFVRLSIWSDERSEWSERSERSEWSKWSERRGRQVTR